MSFDFNVHHIFSVKLLSNVVFRNWFNQALAGGPATNLEMLGNKMALYTDPAQAAAVQAAIANANTRFTDADRSLYSPSVKCDTPKLR